MVLGPTQNWQGRRRTWRVLDSSKKSAARLWRIFSRLRTAMWRSGKAPSFPPYRREQRPNKELQHIRSRPSKKPDFNKQLLNWGCWSARTIRNSIFSQRHTDEGVGRTRTEHLRAERMAWESIDGTGQSA